RDLHRRQACRSCALPGEPRKSFPCLQERLGLQHGQLSVGPRTFDFHDGPIAWTGPGGLLQQRVDAHPVAEVSIGAWSECLPSSNELYISWTLYNVGVINSGCRRSPHWTRSW